MRRFVPFVVFVAFVVSLAAPRAEASVITIEFTGTYDTQGNELFGATGSAVPFHYSLTYDTDLDTNTLFVAAGTDLGGLVAAHDFYGYSASGVVASHITFGDSTWSAGDLEERALSGGLVADFFLDTDLTVALPTRSFVQFSVPNVGQLRLGVAASGADGIFIREISEITDSVRQSQGQGPMQVSGAVPEPTAVAMLAVALGGAALRLRRSRSRG